MTSEVFRMIGREIRRDDRITILSGAGISKESGIPTFRGDDGLWKGYDATQLANPDAFRRDPDKVLEWYVWRRKMVGECKPNPAHHSIAKLEEAGYDVMVVTQNIDNLHFRAGSRNIVELHGNIFKLRCSGGCPGIIQISEDTPPEEVPRECPECKSLIRPHIVWFGEFLEPSDINAAQRRLSETTLLFIVGTSGVVQPAASFGYIAKDAGAYVVEVNIEHTPLSHMADISLLGAAGEILPKVFGPLYGEV
jgi:NAD-dependent deacetylase